MTSVTLRPNESQEQLFKRFKKKVMRSGLLSQLRNKRWFVGNIVLIGDALRTAHFSIGSGTRLAMEDAIALAKALREQPLPKALPAFVAARRPIVDKLVAAADASGAWYDNFPQHMKLAPRDFAWSYIQRSGRIDPARLARTSPRFART